MQPRPISETVNDPRFRCFIACQPFSMVAVLRSNQWVTRVLAPS
jgi:hypothetical protein